MTVIEDWTATVATALGLDPRDIDPELVLDVTRDVAHNVCRPAAPLTAFLLGLAAGRDGGGREVISLAAQKIAALANGYQSPDGE